MRHALVADHDLGDPAGLAQVEEGDATVVAATGDPAGEGDGLAGVGGREGAGVVGADHCFSLVVLVLTIVWWRSASGGVHASGSAATWSPLRMSLTW